MKTEDYGVVKRLVAVEDSDLNEKGQFITSLDGITVIGEQAFFKCTKLTHIILPPELTKIETCAFANCTNLVSCILSEKTTTICAFAFAGCSKLNTINLEHVVNINPAAFSNCVGLTRLVLSSKLTKIWSDIFKGCCKLQEIIINSSDPEYVIKIRQLFPSELQNKIVGKEFCISKLLTVDKVLRLRFEFELPKELRTIIWSQALSLGFFNNQAIPSEENPELKNTIGLNS